jgi:predicted RNA binding protein YcfA (HicA-like mRNA interferase family)
LSQKQKLIEKLLRKSSNFTWNECVSLMSACDFTLHHKKGSSRVFIHEVTRLKVLLHEPHPSKTLLPYAIEILIEGLKQSGELR